MTDGSAPDQRPRPQYGEYATPEEQRARIAKPDASLVYEPAPVLDAPTVPPQPQPHSSGPPAPAAAAGAPSRSRAIDRIVTFALLAYGLVNVVSSFPALVDFTSYAQTMFDLLGVEATLTDPAAGRPWGMAAALVLALGWIATAGVSWISLRRGRLTWWIPLVGGVVFTLLSASLVLVPLMSDPAVWDAMVDSVR